MKAFDISLAREHLGEYGYFQARDGREARIICVDHAPTHGTYPVLALIRLEEDCERLTYCSELGDKDGGPYGSDDLFVKSKKVKLSLYTSPCGHVCGFETRVGPPPAYAETFIKEIEVDLDD